MDALCSQLAKEMNGLEKTVLDNFVTKYAKLRTEGAMSKQQRLQTYGMCMFSNVGLREATEQQRKLAEGILDVVGVLIKGGYKFDNMLNEVVKGRYLLAFVDEVGVAKAAEAKYFDMCKAEVGDAEGEAEMHLNHQDWPSKCAVQVRRTQPHAR